MPVDVSSLLPDWMPPWAVLAIGLPALLWVLAFLLVPFSVIGLKSRIEGLEAQIDSLHEDLRTMGMRMSGVLPPASRSFEDVPDFGQIKRARGGMAAAPEAPRPDPYATQYQAPRGYAPAPQQQQQQQQGPALTAKRDPPPAPRPRRAEPRFD